MLGGGNADGFSAALKPPGGGAAGEALASIARSYAVDISMISRLEA